MLLEGNAALSEILAEALSEIGFEVVVAEACKEALDHLLEEPDPDLLVIDLVDEAAGGEALLSFVADQPELARIPRVIMTDGGEPLPSAAHAAHLVKPFYIDALAIAVRDAMTYAGRPGTTPHYHPAP